MENKKRIIGERDKDAMRWRGRQREKDTYRHTHPEHTSKQETKRERKTEMLKAKEDKAERQLPPGPCSELSAEVPGQSPPLEGLD